MTQMVERQLDTGTVVAVDTEVLGDQLAPAVSLPPAVNLSTNPSFETGVTGWGIQNGSNAPVVSTTHTFVGTQSMLVARGAGTSTLWATRSIGTQVDASKTYVMSAYLWVPAANPTNGGIRVSGTDVTVPATPISIKTTTRDAWARVEFPFTTNAVGNAVSFFIDGGTSGQVWVDAVMLHEGSTALPYGDGDQPGWAWDGTAHASASHTTTTPAAPAGSTTLLLEDVVDFDADGGTLNIGGDLDEHGVLSGGQTLDYESCDDDTSTIVLSAPLAATWDETTPVRPYPLVMEKTAQVMIGNSGEAVPVRVRQRDWPLVRDGIRTGGHGEVVDVELIDDAYVLLDTPGTPPVIDGSYLDPDIPLDPAIVPPPAPPAAPSFTPVPTLTGSVGALFLRMPPVANPTGTVIDVWVGTTASIPLDATTYHGEATGTTYVIEKMPNGTAIRDMPASTVYRVVIRPRNITGNGTASAEITGTTRPVDAADFAVGYLYAGEIDVTQLTGGTFNLSEGEVSVIEAVNAATGAKVGMSGTDGFYVLGAPEVSGQQGPTLVDFPIDGKPNIISGVLQATSLTTTNDATFNGTTTVAPGGTLVLGGQVQAPKAAPSAVASYDIVQHVGYATAAKWTYAGLTLGHDGNWRTVRYDNTAPYTSVVESYHPTTGALVSSTTISGFDARGGIVYSSAFTGRYYMLGAVEGVGWRIRAYDTALAPVWESGVVLADTTPDYIPVLGWDHVTSGGRLLVASIRNVFQTLSIDTYNPTSGALGTATTWSQPGGYAYAYDLAYVGRVTTEYGDRYIFRRSGTGAGDGVKNFQVFTTASVHQTAEEWPAANTATVQGAWYDGTRFRSLDTTGKRFRYEYGDGRHMWDSGSAVREVSYSWYDSAGTTHETTPSPKASVTMPKRARLSVTVNSIPTGAGGADDPNAARIYVGRGTGVANGSMNLEKTIAAPGTAWSTDATVAQESATTHPPTVNGFVTATASSLVATSGGASLDANSGGSVGTAGFRDSVRSAVVGDYAAGWTAYTPTFTAVTTNPTTANFTRTGRYTQRGKQVTFTIVITCNAASGFGVGNYSFGLPVTARNLNEVVVTGAQTGPIHSYVGRSNDATTVNLILTSTDAAMSDTTSGMASGTVLRINGTYEAA